GNAVQVTNLITAQKQVEEMARARLVITSDLDARCEKVPAIDGKLRALIFEPGSPHDLAESIRAGYARRGGAVIAGRKIAAGRTWPALVERYDTVYRDALARNEDALAGSEEECMHG